MYFLAIFLLSLAGYYTPNVLISGGSDFGVHYNLLLEAQGNDSPAFITVTPVGGKIEFDWYGTNIISGLAGIQVAEISTTPVPEPATGSILLSSLALLAGKRFRKKAV